MKEELRKIIDGLGDRKSVISVFSVVSWMSIPKRWKIFEIVEEFESWLNDNEIAPSCY